MSRIADKPNARQLLEMAGGTRCPCGHLLSRHRAPDIAGAKAGPCRDCDCRGLLEELDEEL